MKNYKIIVLPTKLKNGRIEWEAHFPEIKEVIGVGNTPNKAMKEAYENLEVYLEFLEENHIELPKENVEPINYSGKYTVRISPNLHKRIAEYAVAEGVSINQITTEALAEYINKIPSSNVEKLNKMTENISRLLDSTKVTWNFNPKYIPEYIDEYTKNEKILWNEPRRNNKRNQFLEN